jgi:D-alanyl-D-alanine carboxypeptidase (penicillin-binding protein 5/6)
MRPARTCTRGARVALGVLALALAPAAPAAAQSPAVGQRPPELRAPAAILVEPATGDVVFSRNPGQRRSIASTTKLMTALLTLEHASLSREMTVVRYHAAPAESVAGLRPGERLTVADLLRALLLESANDAAATLAHDVAGSQQAFVAMMNRRARELGLTDTHYTNPIGLDEGSNRSSAADLVKLTLILRRNAFFRAVTDLPRATLRSGAHARTVFNRNLLVRAVPFVNGVKTGHTQKAGYVLVGSATRRGVTVISAVLGDPSEAARDDDTLALLRYGLRRYERAAAVQAGRRYGQAKLRYRDGHVSLVASRTVMRTIRPATPVAAAGFLDRLRQSPGGIAGLVAFAAVALASLQLVLLRRRAVRRRRRHARETEIA